MRFTVDGTTYEFDENRMTFAEARALEKVTGHTMGEIGRSGGEDAATMQGMVWVAMKRADPTLRFSDLDDMAIGDVQMLPDEPPPDGQDGGELSDPPGVAPDGAPEPVGPVSSGASTETG